MANLKKIKLADLNAKAHLNVKQLSDLKGGFVAFNGCSSYVCASQRSGAAGVCEGVGYCVSYMGP
jgi:natural product precursor